MESAASSPAEEVIDDALAASEEMDNDALPSREGGDGDASPKSASPQATGFLQLEEQEPSGPAHGEYVEGSTPPTVASTPPPRRRPGYPL